MIRRTTWWTDGRRVVVGMYHEVAQMVSGKRGKRARIWSCLTLLLLLMFAYSMISRMSGLFYSHCAHKEKLLSTSHCPLVPVLQDRTMMASLDRLRACHVVLYNRVPKCASRTVLGVFKNLACQNGFKMVSQPRAENLVYNTQASMIDFGKSLMNTTVPLLFSQHVHFLNFSSLNISEPVYINVVRDPLQRAVSNFYYNKYGSNSKPLSLPPERYLNKSLDECAKSGIEPCRSMNRILPYFCGHHPTCRKGGEVALRRAIRNVREKYLLVGLTEDLPAFMETLSYLLPHFFRNATAVYDSMSGKLWQKFKTVKKIPLKEETESILRQHLSFEFEFYKFVRQRFYHIHQHVRRLKEEVLLRGLWTDENTTLPRDT